MGFEKKLIRNVSRAEPQRLAFVLIAGCFLFSMALFSVNKLVSFRMINPIQAIKAVKVSNNSHCSGTEMEELTLLKNSSSNFGLSNQQLQFGNDTKQQDTSNEKELLETKPLCDFSDKRSDMCEMNGDVRIHGNSSSIYFLNPSSQKTESWSIKPHPRKGDASVLSLIKEMTIKSLSNHDNAPLCSINHNIPAIVFSTGGYMGNMFHDFTDILIPLFITSHQYQGEVQFLISESHSWWLSKYRSYLKELSHYEIIDFDKEKNVHCFPHATIGLISHKEMSVDPSRVPSGVSMVDFTALMRRAYSLGRENAINLTSSLSTKPRLLIIARKWTRSFKNVGDIVTMAEGLGYEAVVAEADTGSNLESFARIVNSCDVIMGVHGAGLTNLVFLPKNAVVIQIVPLGGLEGFAWLDFGNPSIDAKLKYLQYEISEEESTLVEMYPRDHAVFKDPSSIQKQGWLALRGVYLDKQSVRLDVNKFKFYLEQALQLLHQ